MDAFTAYRWEEKTMQLEFLAISDTHLGEETSILSFPHGRQHLWRVLRPPFGSDEFDKDNKEKLEVEEMILLGDIPDRTLSSTSQIITHTNNFIGTLGSLAGLRVLSRIILRIV